MTKIKEGERLDDLGRKGYQIIQDPKRFCFGIDAVQRTGIVVNISVSIGSATS